MVRRPILARPALDTHYGCRLAASGMPLRLGLVRRADVVAGMRLDFFSFVSICITVITQ